MTNKMVPYSLYISEEHRNKLRTLAKNRQGAELVRQAIENMLHEGGEFEAGYNSALNDATKVIDGIKEIQCIAINGKYLNDLMADTLKEMKK